jgi:presenilin-like A22 family membrane protease
MDPQSKKFIMAELIVVVLFVITMALGIIVSSSFSADSVDTAMSKSGVDVTSENITLTTDQQAAIVGGTLLNNQTPEDPVMTAIFFALAMAVAVAAFIVLLKFLGVKVTKVILTILYFVVMMTFFIAIEKYIAGDFIYSVDGLLIPSFISLVLIAIWYFHPEWWIINIIAVVVSANAAGLIGSSVVPSWVAIGMVGLAIYDYVAVIKSGLMMNIVKGSMAMKAPMALIVPYDRSYSFKNSVVTMGNPDRSVNKFHLLGAGDLAIPTVMVVSVYALNPMYSVIVGICIILSYVMMSQSMFFGKLSKIRALPGLPFLCTGAIIGYLICIA